MLNLPINLLKALVKKKQFRINCPDLFETLKSKVMEWEQSIVLNNSHTNTDSEDTLSEYKHVIPKFSLPFCDERDSKNNFLSREAAVTYNNREQCRDKVCGRV